METRRVNCLPLKWMQTRAQNHIMLWRRWSTRTMLQYKFNHRQREGNATATRYIIETILGIQTITVTFAEINFSHWIVTTKYLANTWNAGKKNGRYTNTQREKEREKKKKKRNYLSFSCIIIRSRASQGRGIVVRIGGWYDGKDRWVLWIAEYNVWQINDVWLCKFYFIGNFWIKNRKRIFVRRKLISGIDGFRRCGRLALANLLPTNLQTFKLFIHEK